jgi:hypothetical protein
MVYRSLYISLRSILIVYPAFNTDSCLTHLRNPASTITCRGHTVNLSPVSLRIEGQNSTIFEGPIISGPSNITTASGGTHPCTGTNLNSNPHPGATCTSALNEAACENGFTWDGTFFAEFDDFFITRIAKSAQTSTEFWGILLNYQFTPVGGCQQETKPGEEVLWAFDAFNVKFFLQASTDKEFDTTTIFAAPGRPVTVYVRDGSTKVPIEGAVIGGVVTGENGQASLRFTRAGKYCLKATMVGSLRSNVITVIVV